jgi:ribonuclease HI
MNTDQLLKGKNTLLVGETSVVLDRPKAPHDKSWEKPSQGWLKLNIDGSYQPENGAAGTGMVLHDEEGNVIVFACSHLLGCSDAFEAEAKVCEEGLRLALQWSTKPIMVETDCSNLIRAASEKTQDCSLMLHLILEIRFLVNRNRNITFVKADTS